MTFKTKILAVVLLVYLFVCFESISHSAIQAGLEVLFWDNLKFTAVLLSTEIIGIYLPPCPVPMWYLLKTFFLFLIIGICINISTEVQVPLDSKSRESS